MNLHVERLGTTGPELVMLHGWGLSSAIWQPLLDALQPHYRLTLIDLPGLGRSRALAQTSIDSLLETLLSQAPERALWLGWSLGGSLAIAAAARAPERVSGLLLAAATPCFVQRQDWPWAMTEATFTAFACGLQEDPQGTLNRFALLQTRGSHHARDELRLLKQVMAHTPAAPGGCWPPWSCCGRICGPIWRRSSSRSVPCWAARIRWCRWRWRRRCRRSVRRSGSAAMNRPPICPLSPTASVFWMSCSSWSSAAGRTSYERAGAGQAAGGAILQPGGSHL